LLGGEPDYRQDPVLQGQGSLIPLSVLGTPVKVGVRCRFGCWPCRHPCVVAVGPWSEGQGGAPAAQQGRTTL